MPAPRTTRATTNPTTPPDSTPPDSTEPETVGPDVAVDDPGTPDGATDPTTAPTAAGRDNPAPRASTRPRRGTRSPNAATATAAVSSDDAAREPNTDIAPTDTVAPDPAAAEVTTDDVAPASVDDAETGDRGDHGPVADDVWAELRKQPGCTATELARSVPASRSVVLQLLNRWCAEGSVDTTAGATGRAATRYFALPSTLPPADAATGEPTSPAPAEPSMPEETSTPAESTTRQEPTVPPQEEMARTGTADTHPDTGTPGPARTNSSGSVRLGSGALHGMVEDFLREHPDGEHGPVAVAKAVGRSSGAVANALERMVSSGWAVRTSDKPKRYRIAETSDDAPTLTPDGAASAAPSPVSGDPTATGHIQGVAPVGPVVDGGAGDGGAGDNRDDGTDNAAAGATTQARRGGRVSDGSARSGRKERGATVPG